MNPVKIAIVDDHIIFRKGLRLLLSKIQHVKVVAEADNGLDFIELYQAQPEIDLVFMDISMPKLNGILTTIKAKEICIDLKIIALTSFEDTEHLHIMMSAGANGYILKSADLPEFEKAIHQVMGGKPYFSSDILNNLAQEMLIKEKKTVYLPDFSKREIEVLELICQGHSNIKIGEILFISDRTVERHKTNLLIKTAAENTLNLVIYAVKNKLVKIE